jgi:hypothetical protein
MTDQQSPTTVDPRHPPGARDDRSDLVRWGGWVAFGGIVMTVTGAFSVIQGAVVLISPTVVVTADGTVLGIDVVAWGWVHVVFGALVCATGVALLRGAPEWARGLGIGVTAFSMLLQMAWLPAHPLWSIFVVVLDVVVLYALVVTWPMAITERAAGRGAR